VFFDFIVSDLDSSSGLTEAHDLVRGKESHELWSLDHFDGTRTVNIEVAPGSVEVGVEVGAESITTETLMGSHDFLGSSEHVLLG